MARWSSSLTQTPPAGGTATGFEVKPFSGSFRLWTTGLPGLARLDERIDDRAQFVHTSKQREFLGFASGAKPLVKRFDGGGEPGCAQRGHVQRRTHVGPPAKRVRRPLNLPLLQFSATTPTNPDSGCYHAKSNQP